MTTGKVEKRQAAIVRADGLTIEGYLEKQVAKCSASGFLLKKLTTTVTEVHRNGKNQRVDVLERCAGAE